MNSPIILIEDEANDIFFLKRAMKQAGFRNPLEVCTDGQSAIDYFKAALSGKIVVTSFPCLVLLDLKLPKVMGLEVLEWIRNQPKLRTLIVIILTSSKIDTDIEAAYRLGANSFLVKPDTSEKLLAITELIKHYWLETNQRPSLKLAPGVDATAKQ